MTSVRECRQPSLFVTFPCNPKWQEITSLLLPGQNAIHRHDIIARVFINELHYKITRVRSHTFLDVFDWMAKARITSSTHFDLVSGQNTSWGNWQCNFRGTSRSVYRSTTVRYCYHKYDSWPMRWYESFVALRGRWEVYKSVFLKISQTTRSQKGTDIQYIVEEILILVDNHSG